ncbi:D-alanine-D-alanine ligase [Paenibacillus phyllosphaerae]|uniref:D-alanine--D-alanine ligase n=1 Tax=Paenibacillus phyllosphaerae TaxID=274593 RepID=A0A7W5B3F8_9BACL|nr:D-alanine--D-alanine ligase family protein [Paenibacillus phyllosphaerae]MBB3113221.1 D-alanine-D-alanine ligase [Paenibacillus phyllosphaerae]
MKIRVGVLFGGMSVEHEVSIISGLQALHALDTNKYEPIPIYITKDGKWYTGPSLTSVDAFKNIPDLLKNSHHVILHTESKGVHQLINPKPTLFGKGNKKVIAEIDVAFPVTHGTLGEDGALQGHLELNQIPYVGCNVLASAVGMDKIVMKTVIRGAGIPSVNYVWFYSRSWDVEQEACINRVEAELTYPVIVKPANLGSSVGIKKAANREELIDAVTDALMYSNKVLIEQMVQNLTEVNCSVIGDHEEVETSICEEVLKSDEILSYQDKYMSQSKGGSKGMTSTNRKVPAEISDEMTQQVKELAKRTFLELGCNGVSRIDFLIDKDNGSVYVNEINTIPGSLAFYLWEPVGKSFTQMTSQLITLALKRHRENAQLTLSYDSNILALQGKGGGKLGTKN